VRLLRRLLQQLHHVLLDALLHDLVLQADLHVELLHFELRDLVLQVIVLHLELLELLRRLLLRQAESLAADPGLLP
jgi:hypothetical protein